MTKPNVPLELSKDFALQLSAPLTVLASSEQLAQLKSAPGAAWTEDAQLVPLELDEPLSTDKLNGAGIVVVHVDPEVPSSMERIAQIHSVAPDVPQIVALGNADIGLARTLVREGVSDIVELPLNPEELLQVAIAVMETRDRDENATVSLAPVITVTRALGGGGATTLVTHLAEAFARRYPGDRETCLIDLDVQYGRAADVLGLAPRRTLADLLSSGDRLDPAVLRSVAAKHDSGLEVVAAPHQIDPLEAIKHSQIKRVIDLARREYDYVLLDMPSNLANWTLAVLAQSDAILLVVDQSIASLRQARRRIELFKSVGIDKRIISVAVNRVERKLFGTISMSDIEETLGLPVSAKLHLDPQSIVPAQDQGVMARQIRSKSPFAADVEQLTDELAERFDRIADL